MRFLRKRNYTRASAVILVIVLAASLLGCSDNQYTSYGGNSVSAETEVAVTNSSQGELGYEAGVSNSGDDGSQLGDDGSQLGDASSQSGDNTSQSGDNESQSGTDASQSGDNTSQSGDGASESETVSSAGKNDFSLSDIPAYSDSAYVEVNDNVPYFSASDKERTDAFETYSKLDSLGRCGVAYANICQEIEPTEERGEIGSVKPTGWHTVKYNDLIDGNYLYNRCHLIGYQLAGENANEKNLITGTRYLNVTGMLPFENAVDDYVDRTDNHVLYRVTPIFEGDNLVASGVLMEAYSVEDGGKGISFNVYCYNVQPGIEIDYATGESTRTADSSKSGNATSGNDSSKSGNATSGDDSSKSGNATSGDDSSKSGNATSGNDSSKSGSTTSGSDSSKSDSSTQEFIVNTNTKKFHLPSCRSVKQMSDKNKETVTSTKEDLIEQGYSPCKNCLGS